MSTSERRSGRRPEFPAAVPCIRAEGASRLVEFLTRAFGAEVRDETREDGVLRHAEVRIGDGVVEVSEAREPFGAVGAAIHLYVPGTDAAYRCALTAGGRCLYEPARMPYGERSAGVEDPWGNHWYLATYGA